MIRYYLKFAFRNIRRQQIYSIINIFGLALGIALFLIIALFVKNEYSYDKYNKNYERIYRMEFGHWCVIPPGYGHLLNGQIPEIEKITRTIHTQNILFSYESANSDKQVQNITVQDALGVDSTFFEIFDAEFISGSAQNSLKQPLTIILTETLAKRLFGDEDPLHKEIRLDDAYTMRVDGIIKDPKNSHFMSEAFFSVTSNNIIQGEGQTNNVTSSNYLTYFLFTKEFNVDKIRTKIFNFFKQYKEKELVDDDDREEFIILRPLKDIYFFKEAQFENGIKHGNKPVVNAFIIIAIFILLIAGINFINLTTARAAIRSKEVGIKKVVGSTRTSLILQFLIESVMISVFAMLVALTMLQILLPEFNNVALTDLNFDSIFTLEGILLMSVFAVLIGLISGMYPSLYLSYFNPIYTLKGESKSGKTAGLFRKVLISFQFIIAAILIAGTVVVNQQISFLKNKDLGFKKENIINFDLVFGTIAKKKDFKQKLLQNPNVLLVSFSHGIPGNTRNTNTFAWREGVRVQTRVTSVDKDFIELYEIKLLKGDLINWQLESEQRKTALINETLAKEIGWEDPVGKMVNRDGRFYTNFMEGNFRVVGVIKDYHLESLHTPTVPLAISWDERTHFRASIKIAGNNIPETLEYIESAWDEYAPSFPFTYTFLDQTFDQMYKSEERMQKIAIYFSVLAIFIACLGLFGLSAFMTQRRFKEIGVRKVLGATIPQIIIKLSREFSILVIVSNIIAIPIAWLVLSKWLDDYPYHVEIQWWIFPIALFATLFVALTTVSFHSLKAAKGNPVDAIRHE